MSDSVNIPPRNGNNEAGDGAYPGDAEPASSLVDVLLIMARNRRLIVRTTLVVGCLGLLFALFASPDYTSWARMIREVETDNPMQNMGGLALLRGIGVNLGGSSTGLSPEAFPDVVNSREVRLSVVRDTFYFRELGRRATFTEFANRTTFFTLLRRYTIGLPRTVMRALQRRPRTLPGDDTPALPTEEEEKAIKAVVDLVSTSIDPETGLMTIAATTPDPILSAELANSFVRHLVERVETIRTEKGRRDLDFVRARYREALDSLRAAEMALARFDDRNVSPQSARLRTERARLQRQVTFKSELFSDLQAQLTQAEIDLQRSRPVITILENPVPPIEPSGPRRFLLLVVSLVLGVLLGMGLAFTKAVIESIRSREEGRSKIEEIRRALTPARTLRRVGRVFKRKTRQAS